jgi:hypothetical protein
MNGVIRQVEDVYQEGRGIILDRGENSDLLKGVNEVEEELGGFREVFDLGRLGEKRSALFEAQLGCEAVGEQILDHSCCLWASVRNAEGELSLTRRPEFSRAVEARKN